MKCVRIQGVWMWLGKGETSCAGWRWLATQREHLGYLGFLRWLRQCLLITMFSSHKKSQGHLPWNLSYSLKKKKKWKKEKLDSKCLKLGKNSASNVSFCPYMDFSESSGLKYHVLSMSYSLWTQATGFCPWMAFRGRDRTKQQNTLCFFSTAQISIMLGSGLSSKCCSFGSEEFLFLRWYEKS